MAKMKIKKESKKSKKNTVEAIYRGVSRSFGFAVLNKGKADEEEVYIKSSDSMNALDGDRIEIVIKKEKQGDKKAEGFVSKIIERDSDTIVGIFEAHKDFGFVKPMSKKTPFDIHIERKFFKDAVNESIVECKLLEGGATNSGGKSGGSSKGSQNNKSDSPEGIIVNVLGHKSDPDATILAITKDHKIRSEFPQETVAEAERVAIPLTEKDYEGRRDLRQVTTITIDGEDAKDLDDAVSLIDLKNGHVKLYVSIADVSHYVKEDSQLDREARKRGNSVYLVDRVIPMLPHVLCNGMCSLNENEDRLTKTCEMEFDENGNVVNYEIYEAVIKSNKRMSYTGVHYILTGEDVREVHVAGEGAEIHSSSEGSHYAVAHSNENKENLDNEKGEATVVNKEDFATYEPYREMLEGMYELSKKIRANRHNKGSVDFDFKESKILVDENLKPVKIQQYERFEAHKLIEDFMLIANETVARDYFLKEVPFLYRVHEECDEDKIKTLTSVLPTFGLSLVYKKKVAPMDIQKLLEKVKGKESEYVVSRLALRSMQQARYATDCIGHFALAIKYYTHFTSPIRRYSDLTIHRIIGEYLNGRFDKMRAEHYDKILGNIAMSTSTNERKAIDCERDVDDLMKCLYMKDFIGNEYDGKISGITSFGIFVELDNTIEGMIPLRDMKDDFYVYDEESMTLRGERSKKIFSLGNEVHVKVVNVNEELRAIDFEFVEIKTKENEDGPQIANDEMQK